MIGKKVNNYKIISKIGEGGMGSVFLAEHEILGTKVAIKVLNPILAADPKIRERFLAEAATLCNLDHPNIVHAYDFHESAEGLFIIMQYAKGLTLDELIKTKTGPIPEHRAFAIFSKILKAFQYAHSKRPAIIHRDIKPSNIIIDDQDEPKIIDFGISKIIDTDSATAGHTKTGTKIGTPAYMSPEQILGKDVDPRSDIFSLGITLFTMLTGKNPFDRTLSEFEIARQIVEHPLPRAQDIYPAVSPKAQWIIDKATAKKKEDRFQDCDEFEKSLHQPEIPAEPEKKHGSTFVGIFSVGALLIIMFCAAYYYFSNNPNPLPVAKQPITKPVPLPPLVEPPTPEPPINEPTPLFESDKAKIQTTLEDLINEENKPAPEFNLEKVLSFYQFPLTQYYDKFNCSYEATYGEIYSAVYLNTSYRFFEANWTEGTVSNFGSEFVVHLPGVFTFSTAASPDDYRRKSVTNVYVLDKNLKITSVFNKIK